LDNAKDGPPNANDVVLNPSDVLVNSGDVFPPAMRHGQQMWLVFDSHAPRLAAVARF
jgi:hypothetical protein